MKIYTVHLRRHGLNPDQDLILVREGFSWLACLFSVPWALWHRLWWVALGFAGVALTLHLIGWYFSMGEQTATILSVAAAILSGLLANDLRRWALDRAGFADVGLVSGRDQDEALARYLDGAPDVVRELV